MISTSPKAFLDTQIISCAERGEITPVDWGRVSAYLKHATRYCISALTIGELLSGLANGDSRYFEKHKRRLRLLLMPGDHAEVFDFVPYFLARELGLTIQRPPHLEDDFIGVINLILSAPSKETLLEGVHLSGAETNQIVRIRIDRFAREWEEIRSRYVALMNDRKGLRGAEISPDAWASSLLAFYDTFGSESSIAGVADRLSANYEFEMAVRKLVQNPNFSIPKNKADNSDGQQLCYLCDPNVVFITNDSDFRTRTGKSPQATRIKTFAEVLACAENNSPLL